MVLDREKDYEIKCEDSDGNVWKLCMMPLQSKTNRFQLSFFFNEKEFELSKLQSNRSAEDMWDLLCRIKKQNSHSSNSSSIQNKNLGLNFRFLKDNQNDKKKQFPAS